YLSYMEKGKVNNEHIAELKAAIDGKTVLLIAPGKSSNDEKEKINSFLENKNVVSASVNFNFDGSDYIFLSNLRRFKELDDNSKNKCIVTSNVPAGKAYLSTPYKELLNNEDAVKDNAGLMAVRFFMNRGVKEIYLAGFDGYTHDVKQNYGDSKLEFISKNAVLDAMNEGMNKMLSRYSEAVSIKFLTQPKNIRF
ncbi:MAG: 3-hydroxy-3-methylglutaryl-CoA lyase, partial [Ruminococcus sp.]|nr:3-hydroxy-3-methylglutaryl-CoA lyase [Ruminococcus sp.]